MEETNRPTEIVLERKKRVKRYLGVSALAVAALFLFLPDLAIFDLFPDFIGYVILLCGISQLRDLNDYFGDAYDRFYKVAWLSAVRYLSFFVVLGLVTPQERPDTMLLIAFVFGVFDFIYLIPAWRDLFEGFSYLTARYDGATFETKLRKPKRARRTNRRKGIRKGDEIPQRPVNRIERMRRVTVLFVAVKTVLNVLPELAALTADSELSTVFRLYDYIMILRGCAMTAVVVFGAVWLVSMCRFTAAVRRDVAFLEYWKGKYRSDVLTKDHIFIHRHLQNALFVSSIAMVFRLDFRLDDLHVLPDAFLALLLLVAVWILGRHVGKRRGFAVTASVFAAFSLAVNLYEYYFHYTYSVTSIQTSVESSRAFTVLCSLKVAEQMLFLLMLFLFIRLMQNVVRSYTGFTVSDRETLTPSEKIRAIHKALSDKLKLVLLLAAVSALSKVLVTVLALASRPGLEMDWISVVDFLIAAVFAFFAIRTIREIYAQVEYRFMLL